MSANFEELIKHNFVKFVITVLLTIIVIIVGVGLITNKHINFLGIEFNGEKEVINQNSSKKDTIYVVQKQPFQKILDSKEPIKFRKNTIPHTESKDTAKKQEVNAKDNSHVINGDNNQVGVNGDVNYGLQQRILSQELLDRIISKQQNRNGKIEIWFVRDDKESYNYGDEIYKNLLGKGYRNIIGKGWFLPGCNDEVKLEFSKDSILKIKVCPASNVK